MAGALLAVLAGRASASRRIAAPDAGPICEHFWEERHCPVAVPVVPQGFFYLFDAESHDLEARNWDLTLWRGGEKRWEPLMRFPGSWSTVSGDRNRWAVWQHGKVSIYDVSSPDKAVARWPLDVPARSASDRTPARLLLDHTGDCVLTMFFAPSKKKESWVERFELRHVADPDRLVYQWSADPGQKAYRTWHAFGEGAGGMLLWLSKTEPVYVDTNTGRATRIPVPEAVDVMAWRRVGDRVVFLVDDGELRVLVLEGGKLEERWRARYPDAYAREVWLSGDGRTVSWCSIGPGGGCSLTQWETGRSTTIEGDIVSLGLRGDLAMSQVWSRRKSKEKPEWRAWRWEGDALVETVRWQIDARRTGGDTVWSRDGSRLLQHSKDRLIILDVASGKRLVDGPLPAQAYARFIGSGEGYLIVERGGALHARWF